MQCLWDSDVVSLFIRGRDAIVLQKARAYLNRYPHTSISLLTRYEVRGGWKARRYNRLLTLLESFCNQNTILDIDQPVIDLASDLWAVLSQRGLPIGDSDPILAATALHHGLAVATRNFSHFSRIPGLVVEDWSQP